MIYMYSFNEAQDHIKEYHPICPKYIRNRLAKRISERDWVDASLGRAFGIISDNFIRHNLTEYEYLLNNGVPRAEAREIVTKKVRDIINSWQLPETLEGTKNEGTI